MKLTIVLIASSLLALSLSANDVMQKSMTTMEKGMIQIQQGFLNNNLGLIKDGTKLVREGSSFFSDRKVISEYLPENKKHMVNVAENASKRITLDIAELETNLDNKAYINAANAYSDMLNACSSCHSIVRSW